MKIRLAYGEEGLYINLPGYLNIDVLESRHSEGLPDQAAVIEDVLLEPIDSRSLRDMANQSDTVGIVINDITPPVALQNHFADSITGAWQYTRRADTAVQCHRYS